MKNIMKICGIIVMIALTGMVLMGCPSGTGDDDQYYTVTFNSNGGSAVASKNVVSGGTITLPTAPTRSGYTFDAWFSDNNTFANQFTASTPVTEDITVYAKWTLTAQQNGGVFTLTGIPNGYNGKYAVIAESDIEGFGLVGCESIDLINEKMTGSLISDGSVEIPMWASYDDADFGDYTGNDSGNIGVWIYELETVPFETTGDSNLLKSLKFNVTFASGSAAKSYANGTEQ